MCSTHHEYVNANVKVTKLAMVFGLGFGFGSKDWKLEEPPRLHCCIALAEYNFEGGLRTIAPLTLICLQSGIFCFVSSSWSLCFSLHPAHLSRILLLLLVPIEN